MVFSLILPTPLLSFPLLSLKSHHHPQPTGRPPPPPPHHSPNQKPPSSSSLPKTTCTIPKKELFHWIPTKVYN
ncbi:hypothetical protein HanIR_Chr14g0711391 [Helianthus annuus]|nr:hypothetical protein HanIR_Chr14g0711391 [Helianthus annuus]